MKNVTITLEEGIVALARREAARLDVGLSRFVGDLLQQRFAETRQYELAMRRSLARKPVQMRRAATAYPTREESHERGAIERPTRRVRA